MTVAVLLTVGREQGTLRLFGFHRDKQDFENSLFYVFFVFRDIYDTKTSRVRSLFYTTNNFYSLVLV
jgi:hypothetical protein